MKCPKCETKIKKGDTVCITCGYSINKVWTPGYKWHFKVLVTIYIVIFSVYLILKEVF